MVRTALYSAAAALGLALPAFAGHPHGQAVPVPYPSYPTSYYHGRPSCDPPITVNYRVLYRTCAHDRWQRYGSYDSHYRADRVAHSLQHRGFEVQVVTW